MMKEKQYNDIKTDIEYEYWLANIHPLSDKKKYRLREACKSGAGVYYIEETALKKMEFLTAEDRSTILRAAKNTSIRQSYEQGIEKGIAFIPWFDKRYPRRLTKIPSPPYAIYVKGSLPDEQCPSVAIVGARRCTSYGEQMALLFAENLAAAGVQIISGMARGIDGAGQRGALNAGGRSYGVLGCGADICYPREHIGLYMDLQKEGGVLSEHAAGAPPLREYFPARNRIISGLSDVVLVMEARERSGSLITADMALEQGKEVYALPGPITSTLSRGCHHLIRQGAGVLISAEELLCDLKISGYIGQANIGKKSDKNEKVLESAENIVYSKLGLYPKSIGALVEETQFTPQQLLDKLISMELKGYVKEISKNYYIRTT